MTDRTTPHVNEPEPEERRRSLTPPERETIVNADDENGEVRIWTAQRKVITRLRRHRGFTEVDSGFHGTSEWAAFTIPADQWSPAGGAKASRNYSAEQRTAMRERMAHAQRVRESRSARHVIDGTEPARSPGGEHPTGVPPSADSTSHRAGSADSVVWS